MAFGITIGTPPTSSGPVRCPENAYGSLMQLVIVCAWGGMMAAYKWEELNIALSDVKHPLAVDILSTKDFAENAEARVQARIPSATVHIHTALSDDKEWDELEVVKTFWEQMDGTRATAASGPAGS
jgi:hypothetical protein